MNRLARQAIITTDLGLPWIGPVWVGDCVRVLMAAVVYRVEEVA